MSQVVFLTDVCSFGELGSSRYAGPYVLASQLEDLGYSTQVIDYFTKKENFFEYLKNFLTPETLFVGISSTFLTPLTAYFESGRNRHDTALVNSEGVLWFNTKEEWLNWSAQLKDLVRSRSPKARIVLGGAKAFRIISNQKLAPHIDYFSLGAGEANLFEAMESLKQNHEPSHKISTNNLKYLSNIALKNQLPNCPGTKFRKNWAVLPHETLPLEISRGCKFNCKFCYYEKRNSVLRGVDDIIDEIKFNYDHFGTQVYNITDDCFNDSREKVEKLCEAFIKLPFKIEWTAYARVDIAVHFPHTLDLMVAAGASSLFWGIESLCHEAALKAGKGTHPDKVKKFLVDFKSKYNDQCFSFGSFITGLPGEDEKQFLENLDWVLSHDCLHSLIFGPLVINSYNESLDNSLIDYADYAKNPAKYGFKRVSENLFDWEHETMDFNTALKISNMAIQSWYTKKGNGLLTYAWQYGHFRTLGYSKKDLFTQFQNKDFNFKVNLASEVAQKNRSHMQSYWDQLLSVQTQGKAENAKSLESDH